MRPFRTGLVVTTLGLLVALGSDHGGFLGNALGGGLAKLLGETGSLLVGATALLAGGLLLSGASYGALLRRSGHAVRRAVARPEKVALSNKVGSVPAPALERTSRPSTSCTTTRTSSPRASITRRCSSASRTRTRRRPSSSRRAAEGEYVLPDRAVLRTAPAPAPGAQKTDQRTADTLLEALAHFGIEATLVGQISGPRVTRYELQLAPGTKVSKVAALKDDLSYALATTEIRILAPIPGKQAVGVEVPNLAPRIVTLGDIYDDLPSSASPLAVWLGKDISGTAVWCDLARMPHLLIAGTTGSGKSGCINTILTSVLLRSTPDEVRMILIDPKRIELSYYESIPHLLTPVVSSPKEASVVLANVIAEMERRYERLSLVRARNLPEANRALRARGEQPLPYLLVVIDELADLMMISPQAVEDAVIRLAQKSRAVGIHLVLATQRPSVDVITGMIKANVPRGSRSRSPRRPTRA